MLSKHHLLAAAFAAAVAFPAQAGLIGTTVDSGAFTIASGSWDNGVSAVVGPGIEFSKIANLSPLVELTLDIDDSSFTLHYFDQQTSPSFDEGFLSVFIANMSGIAGVSLASSNFGNGLGPASFNSNTIDIPFTTVITAGADWSATWDITFAPTPEPSAAVLIAAGLALVLGARRLRGSPRPSA